MILVYPINSPAKAGPVTAASSQIMLLIEAALTKASAGTNCARNALNAAPEYARTAPVAAMIA